ncbi:MAG: hypothetical protein K6G33_05035 [Ruminococcus sp.]|uniref:hypothetical protein n=1 Tax=Ruminococcus sp. TaxID=41978 RepID=UPI0025F63585|nr:hypothetical protein [Ruminococcus sp.]MCR5600087.1 hypothetical protein [Ruminococcus sp.]
MKLITLKCPNCDATLEVQDGIDTFYCMYCGNKIMLDGMSKVAYQSKVKVKEMEHKEHIVDKQNEQERFKLIMKAEEEKRSDRAIGKIFIGYILFFLLLLGGLGGIPYVEHRKNIKQLKEIESEINQAINSEDYDRALLLANQLYCKDNWTSGEDEVWDTKRENYISLILDKKRISESASEDYILVPNNSDNLIGKNYSKVVKQFESAGFTNVIAKVSTKKSGLLDWDNTVEHITISGKSSFTKEDTFAKDSTVVIYYYLD